VHLFIDEGQWVLPSMDKTWSDEQVAKMKLVLHGGHYCRSLNIITQRFQNISKNTRSQINYWYRCEKRFDAFGFMIFSRFCIEDMKDDEPVEYDEEGRLCGKVKNYFVNKKHDPVFKAYNTHAMRAKDAVVMVPEFDVYETTRWERIKLVARHVFGRGVDGAAFMPPATPAVKVSSNLPLEAHVRLVDRLRKEGRIK